MKPRHYLPTLLAWAATLGGVSALHLHYNRGGLRQALRPQRARLAVGHLPVT